MKKLNLLIVDDSKELTSALIDSINEAYDFFEIDSATDGVSGYALCCVKTYDIILCDYKMPHINGIKAGMYMTRGDDTLNADTPIILMSSYVPDLQKDEDFDSAALILEKPVNVDTLLKDIKLLLGKKLAA
jgi:CheY-like chemotaxis protein